MAEYRQSISEREFEQQTANIDRRAIRRKKLVNIICCAFLLICSLLLIVEIWQSMSAKKAYNDVLKVIPWSYDIESMATRFDIDFYKEHYDIAQYIVEADLNKRDNVACISIIQLDKAKTDAFKKAFPKAKRFVLKEALGYTDSPVESNRVIDDTEGKINTRLTQAATPKGITFVLENVSSDWRFKTVHNMGNAYTVERFDNGKWYQMPEATYNRSRYTSDHTPGSTFYQSQGESQSYSVNWVSRYGDLPAGKYRYVLPLVVFGNTTGKCNIAIEFEIE